MVIIQSMDQNEKKDQVLKLSIKDALKQGYAHYCFISNQFPQLLNINSVDPTDLLRDDIRIVSKQLHSPKGISASQIAELLAEQVQESHCNESNDETDQVFDVIKKLNFTEVQNNINKALSKLKYYKATNIKLVASKSVSEAVIKATYQSFNTVMAALMLGKRAARIEWDQKSFIFHQIPSEIDEKMVQRMQSLPQSVKDEFAKRGGNINYKDQFARVSLSNILTPYNPSTSDILATDWIILD